MNFMKSMYIQMEIEIILFISITEIWFHKICNFLHLKTDNKLKDNNWATLDPMKIFYKSNNKIRKQINIIILIKDKSLNKIIK